TATHPPCSRRGGGSPRGSAPAPLSSASRLFYKSPPMRDIFNNSDYSILADLQNTPESRALVGILGNPDIRAQRTVQYQLGIKDALTPDLGVDFNSFYKDIRDLLAVHFVSPYTCTQYL